jgi:hypothetical protein
MPWVYFSKNPIEDEIKNLSNIKQISNIAPYYSLLLNDSDEFLEYMKSNKDTIIHEMVEYSNYIYKISIKKDANVLKISSLKQVDDFMTEYGQEEEYGNLIKWNKVSKDYDGVIFTNVKKIKESIDKLMIDNFKINPKINLEIMEKYSWYTGLIFYSMAYILNPSKVIFKYELIEKIL